MKSRNTRLPVRLTAAVAAGLAGAYLVLTAHAARATDFEPRGEPAQAVVRYADLNLANPDGVQRLYQRIVASAHAVCGNVDPRDLAVWSRVRTCTDHSVARAIAAVGHPGLSAFHQRQRGSKPYRHALVMRAGTAH